MNVCRQALRQLLHLHCLVAIGPPDPEWGSYVCARYGHQLRFHLTIGETVASSTITWEMEPGCPLIDRSVRQIAAMG